jgi:hypothetical protein
MPDGTTGQNNGLKPLVLGRKLAGKCIINRPGGKFFLTHRLLQKNI